MSRKRDLRLPASKLAVRGVKFWAFHPCRDETAPWMGTPVLGPGGMRVLAAIYLVGADFEVAAFSTTLSNTLTS